MEILKSFLSNRLAQNKNHFDLYEMPMFMFNPISKFRFWNSTEHIETLDRKERAPNENWGDKSNEIAKKMPKVNAVLFAEMKHCGSSVRFVLSLLSFSFSSYFLFSFFLVCLHVRTYLPLPFRLFIELPPTLFEYAEENPLVLRASVWEYVCFLAVLYKYKYKCMAVNAMGECMAQRRQRYCLVSTARSRTPRPDWFFTIFWCENVVRVRASAATVDKMKQPQPEK